MPSKPFIICPEEICEAGRENRADLIKTITKKKG